MQEKIEALVQEAKEQLQDVKKEADLLNLKSKYLGKKSEFNSLLASLKDMSGEEKKVFGPLLNQAKKRLEQDFNEKFVALNSTCDFSFDESLPVTVESGSLHPVTLIAKEITDVLKRMGFTVLSGSEMEDDYHNFEALNIPKDHPARDMQDTFYLDNGFLLRTQTSGDQVHAMENYGVPLRICSPGRVFRNEDMDTTHDTTFFQIEGMVIDKNIKIENLLYVMREVLREVFQQDVMVRLRPGFFPFTEPSFEMDMSCLLCGGKGCPTCKGAGWIEMIGCGMVHPNVLKMSGVNPDEYTGFAFGIGITRLAMMKYKITDIRYLNSGDLRVLNEFEVE